MSDEDRPEPKYGVYATPEEQRARIQKPDATWALETGESVTDAAASASVGNDGTPRSAVDPARSRAIDRIVTFALLANSLSKTFICALMGSLRLGLQVLLGLAVVLGAGALALTGLLLGWW